MGTTLERPTPDCSAVSQAQPVVETISVGQRLRSQYHALWYRLGERLSWSRGSYREPPAHRLDQLTGHQQARIAGLRRRYAVSFEQEVERTTALKNYDYLNTLDQAWSAWELPKPVGGTLHDVGSSNFWYARTLHAFFRPSKLIGVEVEGYRLYANGYSRFDYAQGYIADLPNTQFVTRDYRGYAEPADVVMAWYPFVTPAPMLAWRMPLSLFDPAALFARIAENLAEQGRFIMVNLSPAERDIAATHCRINGLEELARHEVHAPLRPKTVVPVVSCWGRRESR